MRGRAEAEARARRRGEARATRYKGLQEALIEGTFWLWTGQTQRRRYNEFEELRKSGKVRIDLSAETRKRVK